MMKELCRCVNNSLFFFLFQSTETSTPPKKKKRKTVSFLTPKTNEKEKRFFKSSNPKMKVDEILSKYMRCERGPVWNLWKKKKAVWKR